jgi:DNA polymerase-3 subunit delta
MKKLVLVQGGDAFDLENEIARYSGHAKVRFQADDLKPAALEEALFSSSFFEDTLVIVENGQDLSEKAHNLVLAFVKRPTERVCLLVHASGTTELAKHMPVVQFQDPKPWEKEGHAANFILGYVKSQGVKMTSQVAALLAQTGITDRFLLREECNKLICYVGEKQEITQRDVQAICSLEHEETIWQLTDAFLERNTKKAYTVLQQLLQQQVSPYLIVRTLRNSCYQALLMLSLHESGAKNVQDHFPQLKGKIFDKNFTLAKAAGSPFLTHSLKLLDKTELALKDSPFDEHSLLLRLF